MKANMNKNKNPLLDLATYEQLAEVSSALSHPVRLQILDLLSERKQNCTEILSILNIPKPNLSQHLNVLKRAQLVDCQKSGLFQIYYISNPEVWKTYLILKNTILKKPKLQQEINA
ncbi:MAG: winged helix-turn-helix transcriptional regulator [Bdellovibrionaceae bacterium]|nr:winged helix-turn-helix transcriptional regulator [Pseudobdellovibrionaceae bacterium]